jgi:YegS/Rv2252/BmrU family lipid kinase
MKRSLCLIFNPVSGQGDSEHDLNLIQQRLEPSFQLVTYLTTPETGSHELKQFLTDTAIDLVIASGGDGTVSAVAEALVETAQPSVTKPLGIIPRGTANAFATALGIPSNLLAACDVISHGAPRLLDTARCNDRLMLLLAGVGFEAETVVRANRAAKAQWGAMAYILAGLQQLRQQDLFTAEIEITGQVSHFQAGAITIANAAPPTSVLAQGFGQVIPDDGLLDVTIGTADTEIKALDAIADLLGAAIYKIPTTRDDIICLRTPKIKVTANPQQKVVVDGEILGTTPIDVQCVSRSLSVIVPAASGS